MKQSFYLALRYIQFHRYRTLILLGSVALMFYLPAGLQKLISESEKQMMSRADVTPLIIGAKGNSTDLVINGIYFEQNEIEPLRFSSLTKLNDQGLGYAIPMITIYEARNFPIVGTSLDYFNFRDLEIHDGRMVQYVGECVLGSRVAEELGLSPGDSLLSSPKNFMDLAGSYPLQMEVVGVLAPSNSPDDIAVFTDIKTNWIIMGLGHGHEDMSKVIDPTLVLSRDSNLVTASAKLFIYNKIDGKKRGSFHFHGDTREFPISALLFVPDNHKSETILRGRFKTGELSNQVLVPSDVVSNLLQNIFRIKQIFNTVFLLVGFAVICVLGLIITLTMRLRKKELYTMFTMGSSKTKTIEILSAELLIVLAGSLLFALILYLLTGFFVEDFIQAFIL